MATHLAYQVFKRLYRYYFEILGIAGLLTFLLGWYGFAIATPLQPNTPTGFFDTAYYSLQLFGVEWGPGSAIAADNIPLFVARFLAPVLTGLSVISIALTHLMNRYILTSYLKWFVKDHVVICGLGYVGPEIASLLVKEGKTVVVVERDGANPAIETCRNEGVYVLIDDASQESVLRQVQVQKAGELFIVTGDDARNLGIAYRVKDICGQGRGDLTPLRAHCHIGDAELCSNIRGKTLLMARNSGIVIEPFNIYQIAGYCLTKADDIFERVIAQIDPSSIRNREMAPSGQTVTASVPATHHDLHILIIGMGRMGESLLVRLVRKWRELNNGSRLRLTVVDAEAEARRDALTAKYPALTGHAEVTWLPIMLDHADAVLGNRTLASSLPSVTHTYFCIDNLSLGLSTALTLSRRTAPGSITRIRSFKRSEISPLIEQLSASLSECHWITEFHITSDPCCLSIMRRGMSEQIARLNHEAYLQSQYRHHGREFQHPSVVPWELLIPEKRDSNREQALDLGNKLRLIHYTVAPLTNWDEPLVDFGSIPFNGTTALEAMAEWEHERWMAEKERKDWTYADIPKQDEDNKKHPDMKPYDDLSETVKQYDRDYIKSIPKTLCRMDLKLVPADPSGPLCDFREPVETE